MDADAGTAAAAWVGLLAVAAGFWLWFGPGPTLVLAGAAVYAEALHRGRSG